MKCLIKSFCNIGCFNIKDLFGIQPSFINIFLKYLFCKLILHLLYLFCISNFGNFLLLTNFLNLYKCSISNPFKDISTSFLLLDTLPSAYKKPNQYAFSSVSIQSKTCISNDSGVVSILYFFNNLEIIS